MFIEKEILCYCKYNVVCVIDRIIYYEDLPKTLT